MNFNLFKSFSTSSASFLFSDDSIKFIELTKSGETFDVSQYEDFPLPFGVIVKGNIYDMEKIQTILLFLKKKIKIKNINLAVYTKDTSEIQKYVNVLEKVGFNVKNIEKLSSSLNDILFKKDDAGTYIVAHLSKNNNHVFIRSSFDVAYEAQLPDEDFLLKDSLLKHYLYWHTQKDVVKDIPKIEHIVLVGDVDAVLVDYLALNLKTDVHLGDVWLNILDVNTSVPDLNFKQSLKFVFPLGVAFKNLN